MGHAEEKEKKEAKAIRPCGVLKQKKNREPYSARVCEFQREQKHKEIFSHFERCSPCEEIERNTVRV